jgi:DNA repair protein RecN (Recombination protein N)
VLRHLSIRNYALIAHIETDFTPGLTALTGETGSGKSIILGALGLILGERADTGVLRNQEEKCIIEAIFKADLSMAAFFEEHDLDFDEQTVVRREITPKGKSRAFINDTPVTLAQMRSLGSILVDIHSQQEQSRFREMSFRFSILDRFAQQEEAALAFQASFQNLKEAQKTLDLLTEREAQSKADLDYFQFQYQELEDAQLDDLPVEELEDRLSILENAESIQHGLQQVQNLLTEQEEPVVAQLKQGLQFLSGLKETHHGISALYERLQSAMIELDDISSEAGLESDKTQMDPELLQQTQERLDEYYRLQNKHRCNDLSDLIELRDQLSEKINDVSSLADNIAEQEKVILEQQTRLSKMASELHTKRTKAAKGLEKKIQEHLVHLGMPNAVLRFEFNAIKGFNRHGNSEVQLMLMANKGGDFKPLDKVASGGETSRVTLALKAALAEQQLIRTIIFDEIDTGVSGEMALRMAEIMKQMSAKLQLINITHLPQVAAQADQQFKVYKTSDKNATFTHIEKLGEAERITELAEMLSGKDFGKEALANAKALLTKS